MAMFSVKVELDRLLAVDWLIRNVNESVNIFRYIFWDSHLYIYIYILSKCFMGLFFIKNVINMKLKF